MDARQMREIPIADFLSAMGIHPTKQKGNALWYSAPYRTERTPSFKVDIAKNVWFDFGTGKGGDIFDLAGAFIGSEDFLLRAAFIAKSGTCPLSIIERTHLRGYMGTPVARCQTAGLLERKRHQCPRCHPKLRGGSIPGAWQTVLCHRLSQRCRRIGIAQPLFQGQHTAKGHFLKV